MLVLGRAVVERLLDPGALIDAVARAMADASTGRASMPPRTAATVEAQDAFLATMASYTPAAGVLVAKLVTVFPHNSGGALPTHQAIICCFDAVSGAPVAVMDGTHITAMRTAAGSAVATRLLARPDAAVMALLGTGVQARAHARLVPRVRAVRQIRVAGRRPEAVRDLAAELRSDDGPEVVCAPGYAEALSGADIVCATTHADAPVIRRGWLAEGTHVNSVGYNPAGGEVDAQTVAGARVFVETREAALAPFPSGAADLRDAIAAGVIGPAHIAGEIGEVVTGVIAGRRSTREITLYKSVGVAVQDATAAALVLAAARREGAGVEVALG